MDGGAHTMKLYEIKIYDLNIWYYVMLLVEA